MMSHPSLHRFNAVAWLCCGFLTAWVSLPALLQAREGSRAEQCSLNLQTLGVAMLRYAEVNRQTLPSNRREPFTSWNTLVLPYLARQDLFEAYELSEDWWKPTNRPVGQTTLPELLCPSAPHSPRQIHLLDPDGNPFHSAATDYVASAGVYRFDNKPDQLYRGAMASPGRHYGGSHVTAGHAVKLSEMSDGTSHSMLVVEMADKPNEWHAGKLHHDRTKQSIARPLVEGFSFGQWVAPNWNHLRAYSETGDKAFGRCAVNCSNSGSIYSFHDGYANVLMADGSVRRLRAGLDEEILVALVSIADGELISHSDYLAR